MKQAVRFAALAMGLMLCFGGCQEKKEEPARLKNAMTEAERESIAVGAVSLLDEHKNAGWEFRANELLEIKDSVREITVYDAEMETTFVVHVTLPPDYDADKTYPAFVMTDGVWRFGDHPMLWKMMETDEVRDVLLVSIGYDFAIDGTGDVRSKYLAEQKDLLLDFLTDNLMPYLSEEYQIDFSQTGLYGHSLGGVFTHYAVCHSDLYENQPFAHYIIGSPAFWSPGFLPYEKDPDACKSEYGYFDRNETCDKSVYISVGENEDPDYAEYYGENESTIVGAKHLFERLKAHNVERLTYKAYEGSNHYEYIPELFRTFFKEVYPCT